MARATRVKLAVIGGSGLYSMEALTSIKNVTVRTPFGSPSDDIVIGTLEGERVAFLPRHGRGHRINPSEVNHRANIYALKTLGLSKSSRCLPAAACARTCGRVTWSSRTKFLTGLNPGLRLF